MGNFRFSRFRFRLSNQDKRIFVSLLVLLACLLILRSTLVYFIEKNDLVEEQALEEEWENFQRQYSDIAVTTDSLSDNTSEPPPPSFRFDPNDITKEQLFQLGLPQRTVYTWIHYREKNGRFYKKEDLKKLYTLTDKDYQRLEPYIYIKDKRKVTAPRYASKKLALIPLNTADTTLLKSLPGIGSIRARRIVAFRTALGGFHNVQQLKEVYYLPDSVYEKIRDRLFVDTTVINKISLNQADYKAFSRHPYLRPYARQIIQLRQDLGGFTKIRQIRAIPLINEQSYRKIAPYLSL